MPAKICPLMSKPFPTAVSNVVYIDCQEKECALWIRYACGDGCCAVTEISRCLSAMISGTGRVAGTGDA